MVVATGTLVNCNLAGVSDTLGQRADERPSPGVGATRRSPTSRLADDAVPALWPASTSMLALELLQLAESLRSAASMAAARRRPRVFDVEAGNCDPRDARLASLTTPCCRHV